MERQNNKKHSIVIILVAVFFVASIGGTITCYTRALREKDLQISALESEMGNLTSEISNLTTEAADLKTNLSSAHLVASLKTQENDWFTLFMEGYGPAPSNWVEITGQVTNTGGGTASNAGLHVLALDTGGTAVINMTIPLGSGTFAAGDKINSLMKNCFMTSSSLQLGNVDSGKTITVNTYIYHEGTVQNCVVTPVWTNSS